MKKKLCDSFDKKTFFLLIVLSFHLLKDTDGVA